MRTFLFASTAMLLVSQPLMAQATQTFPAGSYQMALAALAPAGNTVSTDIKITGYGETTVHDGALVKIGPPAVTNTTGALAWALVAGKLPPGLALDPAIGTISGTATTDGNYAFVVKVTDASGKTGLSGIIPLRVLPPLSVTTPAPISATAGKALGIAPRVANGIGALKFTLASGALPPGISLNPTPAGAFGLYGIPTTPGTYTFALTVTDSSSTAAATGSATTGNITVTVGPPLPLTVSTPVGDTVHVGQNAPLAHPVVKGGSEPFTWSIASGALPSGLALNPTTAAVTGATTTPGTFTFTLEVTGVYGATATTAAITDQVIPALALTTPTSLSTPTGALIATAPPSVSNPIGTVKFYAVDGHLPPGMTIDPATGIVSGTPRTAGVYAFAIRAVDSSPGTSASTGSAITGKITITVTSIVQVTTPVGADVHLGAPVALAAPVATQGTAPYTWTVVDGVLPPGLTLDGATGIVSGAPTAYGHTFELKASDANGNTAVTAPISVQVVEPVSLASAPDFTAFVNVPVSTPAPKVHNAIGATTFSLANGALPTGLTLNAATGVVSGTPTTAGSFTYALHVKDSSTTAPTTGSATSANTVVKVIAPAPLTVSTPPAATAYVGVPIMIGHPEVHGGTLPNDTFTWSLASGALPAGLTLNSATGTVSGTPTAAGAYAFSLTVSDNAAETATTGSIAVMVNASLPTRLVHVRAPLTFPQVNTAAGTVAHPCTLTGDLPPGLTLNAANCLISGTPTTLGTFSFMLSFNGQTGETLTFEVIPNLTIETPASVTTTVGTGVTTAAPTLANVVGKALFTLDSGTLPFGMAINPATGIISGIPKVAGVFTVVVKAMDSTSEVARTSSFTITVNAK